MKIELNLSDKVIARMARELDKSDPRPAGGRDGSGRGPDGGPGGDADGP